LKSKHHDNPAETAEQSTHSGLAGEVELRVCLPPSNPGNGAVTRAWTFPSDQRFNRFSRCDACRLALHFSRRVHTDIAQRASADIGHGKEEVFACRKGGFFGVSRGFELTRDCAKYVRGPTIPGGRVFGWKDAWRPQGNLRANPLKSSKRGAMVGSQVLRLAQT